MEFTDVLKKVLGREPTQQEIAGDLADRISSMEEQKRIARENGNEEEWKAVTDQIKKIKAEVRAHHFDPNDFQGLYH